MLLVRKSDILVEHMYTYPEVKYLINALLWGSVAAQDVATICRKTGTWVHGRLIL